jgi:hypothetical protein
MPKPEDFPWDRLRIATSIRVVTINKSTKDGPIICNMSEVDLATDPVYRALSYSWETDPRARWHRSRPRNTVLCNDKALVVGENLHLAMRYLASQNDRTPIWIDAICIHQQDEAEVNTQVQMMGRIYRSARDVIVWLGRGDRLSRKGMRWIQTNCSSNESDDTSQVQPEPQYLFRVEIEEMIAAARQREPLKGDFWEALGNRMGQLITPYVFSLRWFTRIWVLQEAILAQKLSFVLGDCLVSDKAMYEGLKHALHLKRQTKMKNYQHIRDFQDYTENQLIHLHSIQMMFDLRFARSNYSPTQTPLMNYAVLGWNRQASKTKDKVFGVLGLADASDPHNAASTHSFTLRYDQSEKDAFIACTHGILVEEGYFAGLSLARGIAPSTSASASINWTEASKRWHTIFRTPLLEYGVKDLPSWAIDFTCALQPKPLIFAYEHTFEAGLKMQQPAEFDKAEAVLRFAAFLWDEVDLIGEDYSVFGACGAGYFGGDILRILLKIGSSYAPTNETTLCAFARTVTANHPVCLEDAKNTPLRNWGGKDFLYWFVSQVTRALAVQRSPTRWTKAGESLLKEPIDPRQKSKYASEGLREQMLADLEKSWKEFLQMVDVDGHVQDIVDTAREGTYNAFYLVFNYIYEHRRLFITKNGYLGLAPRSLRPGDTIAIVPGAAVPFALRKADPQSGDSAWLLIGEAYVHGVMSGEGMRGKLKKIAIC